ncbi:MAG: SMC family ATPase [Candidatus Altiarchaeota archaeon]|nr:SMC family ATPase [Candidatus Altiarchaeota archaeon]
MKLLGLELENWAVHSRLDVSLENSLQIDGRNGTGKSSILEALRFIFAKDARRYGGKIKNGARSSTVRLAFEDKGNEYLIEKRLHLKRPSEARMLINSEMVASTPSEVYKRLQDILPEDVLDKLLYVPQDGLIELIENLRIKGGRQELDALLGLDRFEKIYKGVSDEIKAKQLVSDEVNNQVRKYEEDAEERYNEMILGLEKENKGLAERINEENGKLRSLESKIKETGEEIEKMRGLKKGKDTLDRKINELTLKTAEDRKEMENIAQNLEALEGKKSRLTELRKSAEKLRGYHLLKKPLMQLRREEEKLVDLGDTADVEKDLTALEEGLKSLKDLKKKRREYEEEVIKTEKALARDKQKLEENEEYIRNLHDLTDKAKCPRCGQRLTKKHVADETRKTKKEINVLEKHISGLEEGLKNSEKGLDEASLVFDELRGKEAKAQYLKTELKKRANDRDNIIKRIESLRQELKDLGFKDESMEFVESRVSEFDSVGGEIAVIQEELGKEKTYLERKEKITYELRSREKELEECRKKSESIEYDEKLLDGLLDRREGLQKEVYGLQNAVRECVLKKGFNEKSIDELQSKRDEFISLKEREKKLMKEINLLKEAQEIFHTNKGIVKYLRERYIAQLSNYTSHYFQRINQNPKYREMAFDKDYNIEVKTTEGVFSLDQLSGGEKVQLAIALRIALIELLSPIKLLILDEPFGSLDKEHREVLGEALNRIVLDKHEQLILVTHVVVDSLNLPTKLSLGGY